MTLTNKLRKLMKNVFEKSTTQIKQKKIRIKQENKTLTISKNLMKKKNTITDKYWKSKNKLRKGNVKRRSTHS